MAYELQEIDPVIKQEVLLHVGERGRRIMAYTWFWGAEGHSEKVMRAIDVATGNYLMRSPAYVRSPEYAYWFYFYFNGTIFSVKMRRYPAGLIEVDRAIPQGRAYEDFKASLREALAVHSITGHVYGREPALTPVFQDEMEDGGDKK